MSRTVKVIITSTVAVDIDRWATEYGVDSTAKAVREDVKNYFAVGNNIPDHLSDTVGLVD